MKPRSGVLGVDFKAISIALYAEREPTWIQYPIWIELMLHILHDLG